MDKHSEKYASPKEVEKTIHAFKKLLWVMPKEDRENIVSFIRKETKCCSWWPLPYVSKKLFATLTGTLSSANLKNKIEKEETLPTPFSKVLKSKKKACKFMGLIRKSMSFISVSSPEEKEKLFDHIVNEPTYYKIKNKIKLKPLIEKFSEKLLHYGFSLISPNYKKYNVSQKILNDITSFKRTKPLSNKEINILLGNFISSPKRIKPLKITTSKNKLFHNISKDIRVHNYE